MAWHHWGDKPLSEPMMVSLLTHICVTLPQWVKMDITIRLVLVNARCMINYYQFHMHIYMYINGLVQERHNSSVLAMKSHLSCINPLIWDPKLTMAVTTYVSAPNSTRPSADSAIITNRYLFFQGSQDSNYSILLFLTKFHHSLLSRPYKISETCPCGCWL